MCVGCNIRYNSRGDWHLQWFWGRWYNFVPPKYRFWALFKKWPWGEGSQCCKDKWYRNTCYAPWRGEGNPAPWLMIWKDGVFGFEIALQRFRSWLKPELTKPGSYHSRQLMWGSLIVAWRTK